jgi:hypothetical protein
VTLPGGAPGPWRSLTLTREGAWGTGSGFSTTASITLKAVVSAAMPAAMVTISVPKSSGERRHPRQA